MVNYRRKLNIDFDLSDAQIGVLERPDDTLVRAVPGSGKTTILTLKIKNLLLDDKDINKICCISYTNVNVEDLEKSCEKRISKDYLNKIDFLTFHKFCLQYILSPFSFLYKSKKNGLRVYKNIFNFREHGKKLIDYLSEKKCKIADINYITKEEKIYYNFIENENGWIAVSNKVENKTLNNYLSFLNKNKLIDFNLISLLSLFIVEENQFVRIAVNRAIDWMFIDEFQDVSDIQCRIIESLRKTRGNKSSELKWFLVGDPNQSIYGFAGANPRSMYDMREIFNNLNGCNCEIRLDKTHRCAFNVFEYARTNYNNIIEKVKNSTAISSLNDAHIISYLDDLLIPDNIMCNNHEGRVVLKNTVESVQEVLKVKFSELIDDEVCCIGVTSYNSIEVYKKYKLHASLDEAEDFGIYADLYKDYEDKYGFKYFSLFVRYLVLKNDFYNNRVRFYSSVNKYFYLLKQFLVDKIPEEEINAGKLKKIVSLSSDLLSKLKQDIIVNAEFFNFSKNINSALKECFPEYCEYFLEVSENNEIKNFENINLPTIGGFLKFAMRATKEKITFEIKHIHKIKGMEYEQVIVQKIEDLPYRSYENKVHQYVFHGNIQTLNPREIYDYIQEINKLYVMLTRSKKNLYIVLNNSRLPELITIENNINAS